MIIEHKMLVLAPDYSRLKGNDRYEMSMLRIY